MLLAHEQAAGSNVKEPLPVLSKLDSAWAFTERLASQIDHRVVLAVARAGDAWERL